MASKVAVISSDAGGLSEINIHGETGYLTKPDDIELMSKYAISILKDSSLLEKFKNKAFKMAKAFDINNIVPIYEKIYKRALNKLK